MVEITNFCPGAVFAVVILKTEKQLQLSTHYKSLFSYSVVSNRTGFFSKLIRWMKKDINTFKSLPFLLGGIKYFEIEI